MLRRQGIWNKQVHDFTTSTRGTKQTRSVKCSAAGQGGLALLWAFKQEKKDVDRTNRNPHHVKPPPCHTTWFSRLSANWTGRRTGWKAALSLLQGLLGLFWFRLALRRRNEVLWRRTEFSKWCLSFVFFATHARPPHLPQHTHLFISITPAITGEERMEREAALWCFSDSAVWKKKQKNICATQQRWV